MKRVLRPGPLVALLAVLGVGVAEAPADWPPGLAGAALGVLAGLTALQVGMLAGALVFGARVHRVVLGLGRRWREWVTPRYTVVLRRVPVLLSVSVGPGRPPLRTRMWAAALCSAVAGAALPVALWWTAPSALGRGLAIGAAAVTVHSLIPRRDALTTSTGWLLFGLPRLSAQPLAELRAGVLADEAIAAVHRGDLAAADQAVDRLTAAFPHARATTATRVAVLEAHGRYAEALAAVLALAADPAQSQRDAALALAGVAGLAVSAVEAGQVPADAALPTARQALTGAVGLGYPSPRLDGTRAVLALLDGDPDTAARLAGTAAASSDHLLSRADDLATLARARMAGGDNQAARAALAEAESLAPWWPRVAATRARLDL